MQRDTERDMAEAQESLEEAFRHLHWLMMAIIRVRYYLTQAQTGKGDGKGNKGDGKGNKGDGKGQDKGKGKGYGKPASSHNLRTLLIYLLRSLC